MKALTLCGLCRQKHKKYGVKEKNLFFYNFFQIIIFFGVVFVVVFIVQYNCITIYRWIIYAQSVK